jgi:hypothetical protein
VQGALQQRSQRVQQLRPFGRDQGEEYGGKEYNNSEHLKEIKEKNKAVRSTYNNSEHLKEIKEKNKAVRSTTTPNI